MFWIASGPSGFAIAPVLWLLFWEALSANLKVPRLYFETGFIPEKRFTLLFSPPSGNVLTNMAKTKDFLKTNLSPGSHDSSVYIWRGLSDNCSFGWQWTVENLVASALTMSGISVRCGYLLSTIDVGADWTRKCHTGCVGKIFMTATESTNTSECRNADKTGASSSANFNSHSKIKPDGKRSLWRNGWSEVIAAQPCPTLCDPMDCGAARLLRPWDSAG